MPDSGMLFDDLRNAAKRQTMTTNAGRKNSHYTWNIVTRGLHGHPLLRQKISSKIRTLERHLQRFPSDAVHLLIELERHPRKPEHRAVLTLRLPSHILHADKSAKSVIAALSNAVRALLKELTTLKQRLREEPQWKRKARRRQLSFAPAPTESDAAPQGATDIRNAFFESYRQPLMRFARRILSRARRHENSITDREIAEIVGEAKDKLAALSGRRVLASERARLYRLVRDVVARRGGLRMTHSAAAPAPAADNLEAQSGLLPAIDQSLATLPKFEREVFDLYYVEGFEPDEIAMITRKPVSQVKQALQTIEDQIRRNLRSESVRET
jgi:ribosomal subunit interface protein